VVVFLLIISLPFGWQVTYHTTLLLEHTHTGGQRLVITFIIWYCLFYFYIELIFYIELSLVSANFIVIFYLFIIFGVVILLMKRQVYTEVYFYPFFPYLYTCTDWMFYHQLFVIDMELVLCL
jgi:hypothetical protein